MRGHIEYEKDGCEMLAVILGDYAYIINKTEQERSFRELMERPIEPIWS